MINAAVFYLMMSCAAVLGPQFKSTFRRCICHHHL